MTREQWKAQYRRRRAERSVQNLPGHGHARHGSQTTINQQITRAQTGIAPDGKRAPTTRATRFDSPEAELEAVGRAKSRTGRRNPPQFVVDEHGKVWPNREISVVGDRPGGYGSGVEVQLDQNGRPLAGNPIQPTGQDANAMVVLEYNPATGTWDAVTQFPTNKPVTP